MEESLKQIVCNNILMITRNTFDYPILLKVKIKNKKFEL